MPQGRRGLNGSPLLFGLGRIPQAKQRSPRGKVLLAARSETMVLAHGEDVDVEPDTGGSGDLRPKEGHRAATWPVTAPCFPLAWLLP